MADVAPNEVHMNKDYCWAQKRFIFKICYMLWWLSRRVISLLLFFKDHHEKIVGIWSWVWVDWSAMHDMRGSKVHLPKINFQLSTRTWFLLLSKSAFQRKALENNFIQNFTERYILLQTGRLPYSPPFLIFANLDFHLRGSAKYYVALWLV